MSETPQQTLTFPKKIDRCIYCGTTSGRLTDEHIVPYGLNGKWVLQQASCKLHADITSDFEREVLRDGLEAFRAVLGTKTRRPKQRKEAYSFRLRSEDTDTLVELPTAQHPGAFCFPFFSPAGSPAKSGIHPTLPV